MKGILTDGNYELSVKDGELVVGDNTEQITELVLNSIAGEAKADPTSGIGVVRMVGGHRSAFLAGEIKEQMERQKIAVKNVTLTDNGLSITLWE